MAWQEGNQHMSCKIDLSNPAELSSFYRAQLLEDCVPFWIEHGLDHEHGGYLTMLERDGTPYGSGKFVWGQGRAAYVFAKLYNTVERRSDWLEASRLGVEFLRKYALDKDGTAYYKLGRDGTPLYARPGEIFAESFMVLALAEYARATGSDEHLHEAVDLYWAIINRLKNGDLDRYSHIKTPQYREHAVTMIMINTTQELREADDDSRFADLIRSWVHDELYVFARDEQRVMFERFSLLGQVDLTEPQGRSITPGHCLESCWFCLKEGLYLNDRSIVDRACQIMDWTLSLGWDTDYGGIYNFLDYEGKPPGHHDEDWGEDQDWDEKLFWVHSEALFALLLASQTTGQDSLAEWYWKVHSWTFEHFPDSQYGEWFGYLRRDGSISQTLKGGTKGFFHVPRALLNCMLLLESKKPVRKE